MGRLVTDDRKATVTQITTRYNQDMQNTIYEQHNTSNPEADELQQQKEHTGCRSCQLRTGTEDTIHTGSPKLDNRRLEKRCRGLMSLDFCCATFRWIGSEFVVKNMKAWIHPCVVSSGSGWW